MSIDSLPLYIKGTVVKGYGRGSSQLGFPTANIEPEECKTTFSDLDIGVYFGWSFVEGVDTQIEPMVMSVGWNPTFDNKEKSFVCFVLSLIMHLIFIYKRKFMSLKSMTMIFMDII